MMTRRRSPRSSWHLDPAIRSTLPGGVWSAPWHHMRSRIRAALMESRQVPTISALPRQLLLIPSHLRRTWPKSVAPGRTPPHQIRLVIRHTRHVRFEHAVVPIWCTPHVVYRRHAPRSPQPHLGGTECGESCAPTYATGHVPQYMRRSWQPSGRNAPVLCIGCMIGVLSLPKSHVFRDGHL